VVRRKQRHGFDGEPLFQRRRKKSNSVMTMTGEQTILTNNRKSTNSKWREWDMKGRLRDQNITISFASEANLPGILKLIRGLAEYEHFGHLMTANEEDLRNALFGPWPVAEVLIASCGDELPGFALYYSTFCSVLGRRGMFLDNLFVRPEWQGVGVGGALLNRLAAIAAERGCARIDWVCLNWNKPALGFYQSEGAEFLPEWTRCRLNEDAIHRLANMTGLGISYCRGQL
jgi:GNAT superfamily N-acetyltransferase